MSVYFRLPENQNFAASTARGGAQVHATSERPQPALAGWTFSRQVIADARRAVLMPNPSIDLSNPCNLNCPYCFIEEKSSARKLRRPQELSLSETHAIVDDFIAAGALTVNIVGAGEPT